MSTKDSAGNSSAPKGGKSWKEGKWAGVPHYTCTRCPFETTELERMEQHAAEPHDDTNT